MKTGDLVKSKHLDTEYTYVFFTYAIGCQFPSSSSIVTKIKGSFIGLFIFQLGDEAMIVVNGEIGWIYVNELVRVK